MQNEISVYVDIIFVENLLIDYVLIDLTGKTTGFATKPHRIFIGAALGALYAVFVCVIPVMQSNVLYSLAIKIITSFLMCIVAFGLKNKRKILIGNFILIIASFLFAGVLCALQSVGMPLSINNGGVVIKWGETSVLYIIEMLILGYVIFTIFFYYMRKCRKLPRHIMDLKVCIFDKDIHITALCDTGNELHDNLHNLPVVICESDILLDMLDSDMIVKYSEKIGMKSDYNTNDIIAFFVDIGLADRISVVPFKTVNSENDIMVGLVVDRIVIVDTPEKEIKGTICFVNRKLSALGEYNGIVSPEIFLYEN